jgi:hypothetical protein
VLTVADPCIWHGCGTNPSRRQSATTAGAPTDQARVCLAAAPPASVTLSSVASRFFRGERSGTRLRRPFGTWITKEATALCVAVQVQRVHR